MRHITVKILAGVALLLAGWDVVVAFNPETGDTISEITHLTGTEWVGIPFALGALMGHFFFPSEKKPRPAIYWGLFGTLVALTGSFFVFPRIAKGLFNSPSIALLVGIPVGALLWPQAKPKASK